MKRRTVTDSQASAFIATCMAPLPAETKEFLRELEADLKPVWRAASLLERQAFHVWRAASSAHRYEVEFGAGDNPALKARDNQAWRAWHDAVARLLLTPAPHRTGLLWKRKRSIGCKILEVAAAIAADEARLGVAS